MKTRFVVIERYFDDGRTDAAIDEDNTDRVIQEGCTETERYDRYITVFHNRQKAITHAHKVRKA